MWKIIILAPVTEIVFMYIENIKIRLKAFACAYSDINIKYYCIHNKHVSVFSAVHKTCFITFVFSSQIYMLISCILLKWFRLLKPTEDEKFSIGLKWFLFWINLLGCLSAAYFFARHNSHCEPMGEILSILFINMLTLNLSNTQSGLMTSLYISLVNIELD